MKTLATVAIMMTLLSGCALTKVDLADIKARTGVTGGDSVYLQHPDTNKIAECNLPGSGVVSFTFSYGIGEAAMQASCIVKWQERGFVPGPHDALKQAVKEDPTLEARSAQ